MKKRKRKSKNQNSDIKEMQNNNDSPKEAMERTDRIVRHISKTKYTGMGK